MKTKSQEIKQGDYVLITDRSSKFKTKYGVVKKVQSRGYIVTVEDNGKSFDAKVTKKGVLFSEKGKSEEKKEKQEFIPLKVNDIRIFHNNRGEEYEGHRVKVLKIGPKLRIPQPFGRSISVLDLETNEKLSTTEYDIQVLPEKEPKNKAFSQEEILTKEIEKIEEEIIALEKKRDELQEQKTKIIAQEILDGKRNAQGKPFMPWQKELTDEEIEFIISAINRYGSGDHPKASKDNWLSFKFDYIKGVLQKIDVKEHLGAEGAVVFKSVLTKFNL